MVVKKLKLCSYNCKHFNDLKVPFCKELLSAVDFVLLQEHCLFYSKLDKLYSIDSNISFVGTSAMKEGVLLTGRPHGGCCIIWKAHLQYKVEDVICESDRLCAVVVTLSNNVKLLIMCVYMPCDGRCYGDNLIEFNDVLGEVTRVVHRINADCFVIGGDFNTDLSRNTPQVNALNRFLGDESCFAPVMSDQFSTIDYTYSALDGEVASIIDHVFTNNVNVSSYVTIDSIDNLSDHLAVSCELNVDVNYSNVPVKNNVKQVSWKKATVLHIDRYRSELCRHLEQCNVLNDLNVCDGISCKSPGKCEDTNNKLYDVIVNTCSVVANECIPMSGPRGKSKIPGWKENIEPVRQRSIFWHALWKDNGRPQTGIVASIMRKTRKEYHIAVKVARKRHSNARYTKMAQEIIHERSSRDLWSEVKRLKGSNKGMPNVVDGIAGDKPIADLFADKFSHVYNSVSYDASDMSNLHADVNSRINCKCMSNSNDITHLHVITPNMVENAAKTMKPGKRDGSNMLATDHIIHGSHNLYILIATLFSSMLSHGHCPSNMLYGKIVPIPKVKGSNKADNYRSITLGSVLCKLFELISLNVFQSNLMSCDLQFGFKKQSSTASCTFILQETVSYFNRNGSNVYCVLLDASKAFDRLHYCILFRKLLSRNICPLWVRILLHMYKCQSLSVQWNGSYSNVFNVSNGVKQGGIISPTLFCLYVDELLSKLKESGMGCHIGTNFVGALSYADDIALLSPTTHGMNCMLDLCSQFAKDNFILFNAKKSNTIIFHAKPLSGSDGYNFMLNDSVIPVVKEAKHLGHSLCNNIAGCIDVNAIITSFARAVNIMFADFGQLPSYLLSCLFYNFCCSFYGVALCNLYASEVHSLHVAWRKCVRKVLRVHPRTHNVMLPLMLHKMPIECSLLLRVVKFYCTMLHGNNEVTKCIARRCLFQARSNMGQNISHVMQKHKINFYVGTKSNCKVLMEGLLKSLSKDTDVNDSIKGIVDACIELIDVRDGMLIMDTFSTGDCKELLDYLCTF